MKVECYAGYRADQRPLRFILGTNPPRTHEVAEVLDQWCGEDYRCFRVLADDGDLYILRHDLPTDDWSLDSYRQQRTALAAGGA